MTVPRVATLVALLCLALPAAASADADVGLTGDVLTVTDADATAANSISLSEEGDEIVVREHNLTLVLVAVPNEDCTQDGARTVRCPKAGLTSADIDLGGGNDTLRTGTGVLPRNADGGSGDDDLSSGPGHDLLDGGDDDDVLRAGPGDDEFVGGDDRDHLTYATYEDDVEVALPEPPHPFGAQGAAGEDDRVHSDVEDLTGGDGDDVLTGSSQANRLAGGAGADRVAGEGGDDTVTGDDGFDTILGGSDDDVLDAADGGDDLEIDCGPGEDRLDADNDIDGGPEGCESIAPEIFGTPTLVGDPVVGGYALFDFSGVTGTTPTTTRFDWFRCGPDGGCAQVLSGDAASYLFEPVDTGSTVYAAVYVANAAGSDEAQAAAIGPIQPAPPPPPGWFFGPPPPDYRDYGDYGDYGDYLDPLRTLEDSVAARLRGLTRRFNGRDPRSFARARAVPHPVLFPDLGTLTLTWTVQRPGGTARAAAGKRIVIARGKRRAAKGKVARVAVRPTKRGRAILRRSKRLTVTLRARFVGGAATKVVPATAKRSFRLKRR